MQAAAAALMMADAGADTALMGAGQGSAPIERLPDEVLELLFRVLDSEALLMAVPAVSAWADGMGAWRCPALGQGVRVGPASSAG